MATLKESVQILPNAKQETLIPDVKFQPLKDLQGAPELGYQTSRFKEQKRARMWGNVWDAYKLVINPYWMVNPTTGEIRTLKKVTGIEVKPPEIKNTREIISRAYHKMLEMAVYFRLLSDKPPRVMAAIAEAPGGFIQAIAEYYKFSPINGDRIVGISLLEKERVDVPKFAEYVSQVFTPTFGKDGTGNICQLDNIREFAKNFPKGADLATADGGFEVENWLEKEYRVLHLLFSECLAAIKSLHAGGNFVCKTYSLYTPATLQIIHILTMLFKTVALAKPATSRVTNTEHYLVCQNFTPPPSGFVSVLEQIKRELSSQDGKCGLGDVVVKNFIKNRPSKKLTEAVRNFNNKMEDMREAVSLAGHELIIATLHNKDKSRVQKYIDDQIATAKKWLQEHSMI